MSAEHRPENLERGWVGAAGGAVSDLVAVVKPRLRGWLHVAMFPVAVIGGLVLVLVSDPGAARTASIVFTVSAALLFGVSAIYHRGTWGPRASTLLKRLDHSNIYLIIAGTYTPFAVTLLPADQARLLLSVIWGAGHRRRPLPRLLGRRPALALHRAVHRARLGRGLLGRAVLARRRPGHRGPDRDRRADVHRRRHHPRPEAPRPVAQWFGFHEVFHAFTLGGFLTHFAAVALAIVGYQAVS